MVCLSGCFLGGFIINDIFLLGKLVLSSFFLFRGLDAVIKVILLLGILEILSVFFLFRGVRCCNKGYSLAGYIGDIICVFPF
jgi:hypothetical protein